MVYTFFIFIFVLCFSFPTSVARFTFASSFLVVMHC